MKVQLPWLNKAAGRSAGTIYQSYWGATYTRSMPALFHYPATQKQQATQATFFDLQRIWIPIYNHLSQSIQRQQRKNKNPFNIMSSFIYKILQPFNSNKDYEYIKNFGLDRLNRVKPDIPRAFYTIDDLSVVVDYELKLVTNATDFVMTTTNIILFNPSRMSMYFTDIPFEEGHGHVSFKNTNEWKHGDLVLMYISLSCDSWLGNFNLVEEWLK